MLSMVFIVVAGLVVLASCAVTPSSIAKKYSIPSDPFDAMTLEVVDASRAYNPDASPELYWDLHLSDPQWASQLATWVNVMVPSNNTGEILQQENVVTDSSGNVTDVVGMTQDTNTQTITFGTFQVLWELYKDANSSNNPVAYADNFTGKGPDGNASGTYYVDGSTGSAKFADVADFSLVMYSDGLAITLTRGTINTAQSVEFDFYSSATSASPLAVLTLDSSALSTLVSSGTILVQPSDLTTLYANVNASSSTAWYADYFTINNPNPTAAQHTVLVYVSYLGPGASTSTNNSTTADPNSDPKVTVGAISKSMAGGSGSSFITAAQGAKPFLPKVVKKK